MAHVLSLQPHSPFKRSFSDTPYLPSCSQLSVASSSHTLRQPKPHSLSTGSLETCPSARAESFPFPKENIPLTASPPRSLLSVKTSFVSQLSRDDLPATPVKDDPPRDSVVEADDDQAEPAQVTTSSRHAPEISVVPEPPDDAATGADDATEASSTTDSQRLRDVGLLKPSEPTTVAAPGTPPFKRWVSTLRRRNRERKQSLKPRMERWSLDDPGVDVPPSRRSKDASSHRKSESQTSSMGLITAVKTASVTLASQSVGPLRSRASRMRGSGSEVRLSLDSNCRPLHPIIDEATWLRSLQRRKVLEELVSTEEGYVADMKAFVNVYSTLLASMPTVSTQIRHSVEQIVTQIVELHDDVLGELYKVIPNAELTQPEPSESSTSSRRRKHIRWHSADVAIPRSDAAPDARRLRHSFEVNRTKDAKVPVITADTATVAKVAKVFNKLMRRFLVYEAWAAQSESLHKDILSTYRSVPSWPSFERGLETLAVLEGSINSRGSNSGKGMTLPDLLIKPIQRVCRYPLIFESLCRQTPACDDPVAHDEVQKVLIRLREMADEINRATNNPRTRQLVESTWTLQDRISFGEHVHNGLSSSVIFHLLGHVLVCGVLHVSFETRDCVRGQYVICVLYRSCLLLATMSKTSQIYNVMAVVPLANASVDEPDNAQGLQCHNAPHTWKLVFESQHRLFELMLTGCSAKEEEEWRLHLRTRITAENHDLSEGRSTLLDLFSLIPPDLRPLSAAFGQPESLARRISIQRAATLGPKTQLRQIIIKNTQAVRSSGERDVYLRENCTVARSQSHLSSIGHVTTLSPRRSDRIRLENALADVWTTDVLPYPGLASRRQENSFRASANSVMRKLSMASLASNFSKRSVSHTSVSTSSTATTNTGEDQCPASQMRNSRSIGDVSTNSRGSKHGTAPGKRSATASSTTSSQGKPVLVDFHSAPSAFLPEDFELKQLRNRVKERPGGSVRELKRRFGEYGKELRPLTPIVATGRSSRAESHSMTIQEALARPSMMEEAGAQNAAPGKGAEEPREAHGGQSKRTQDKERKLLVKSPSKRIPSLAQEARPAPPVLSIATNDQTRADDGGAVASEKTASKPKGRFFRFWG